MDPQTLAFPSVLRPAIGGRPGLLARLAADHGPIALAGARGVGKSDELRRVGLAYELAGHGPVHHATPNEVARDTTRWAGAGGGRGRPLLVLDGPGLDGLPPREAYAFLQGLVEWDAYPGATPLSTWRIVAALPSGLGFEADV